MSNTDRQRRSYMTAAPVLMTIGRCHARAGNVLRSPPFTQAVTSTSKATHTCSDIVHLRKHTPFLSERPPCMPPVEEVAIWRFSGHYELVWRQRGECHGTQLMVHSDERGRARPQAALVRDTQIVLPHCAVLRDSEKQIRALLCHNALYSGTVAMQHADVRLTAGRKCALACRLPL